MNYNFKIFMLMKYDSYSRFLKSQMYKECIVNEMEGKPIISAVAAGKKPSGVGMGGGRPQSGSKAGAAANSQTNVNDEAAATTNVMLGGGGPGANSSITNLSATTTTTTSQQTGAQSSQQSPSLVASSSASNLFQQLNPSTGTSSILSTQLLSLFAIIRTYFSYSYLGSNKDYSFYHVKSFPFSEYAISISYF